MQIHNKKLGGGRRPRGRERADGFIIEFHDVIFVVDRAGDRPNTNARIPTIRMDPNANPNALYNAWFMYTIDMSFQNSVETEFRRW